MPWLSGGAISTLVLEQATTSFLILPTVLMSLELLTISFSKYLQRWEYRAFSVCFGASWLWVESLFSASVLRRHRRGKQFLLPSSATTLRLSLLGSSQILSFPRSLALVVHPH